MSTLTLRNITKSYGDIQVLKDINIEIGKGEFLVLLGPSGCGKSTLLHAIAGLHTVTSGDIVIGNDRVNDVPCQDRDIAMVFQSYALYPSMTVEQNIAFPLEMRRMPTAERKKAVADVARLLKIEPLMKRKPSQLSGGQRQRVAIGRALVRDPQLFLFDEPLSNLDALLRVEMRTELKKLHGRIGRTTVYVTHDQVEAMTLASRIAILNKGVLQQVGTPAEVYNRPANLFVAGFIGAPEITLLPGTVIAEGGRRILRTTAVEGQSIDLPLPDHGDLLQGRKVTVGLRPEAFSLGASASPSDALTVTLPVDVSMIEPTGPEVIVLFGLAGIEAEARAPANCGVTLGRHEVRFSMADAIFFDTASEQLIC